MVSVCYFLSVAVARGWELQQMDTNNAFLDGDLDEEVSMTLNHDFCSLGSNKVCKAKKSLQGLKQVSRQ